MGIINPPQVIVGPVVIGGPLTVTTGPITLGSDQFLAPNGTEGAPSYAFSNDPDIGMYRAASNTLGFAAPSGFLFGGQATAQGLTTTSPGWYAQITGDAVPRVRVGLNATDAASIGFGSGAATRDTFIERAGAAVLRFGAPDVASGAVAQTLTFQGNTGSTTNGPLALIRGAGGGSSTSVGGELRLSGGLSSAAAGTGGAITFYTAPSGAGATPALALTIASTGAATFTAPVSGTTLIATSAVSGFQFGSSGGSGSINAQANGTFRLQNANASNSIDLAVSGGVGGLLTVNGGLRTTLAASVIGSAVALTDGAGAGAGTILNAPAAGNPTKWIGINDNGVIRYCPCW